VIIGKEILILFHDSPSKTEKAVHRLEHRPFCTHIF
jgi:hypothetical protein